MQRMETKDYSVKETKGEQRGVDKVGGEQRRSVSFIAHSRPLREGLTSQGLRGSGQAAGLPRYLLQVKTTTHRRPPWPAATNERCESSFCHVKYPRTSLAPRHEASRAPMASTSVPARSCATGGCVVSTRAFCTASFQRREISIPSQSVSRLAPRRHVRTSTHPRPILLHRIISAHRLQPHPTLRCPLAHAGCNPEFCRPRTTTFAFCFDDRSLPRCARADSYSTCS